MTSPLVLLCAGGTGGHVFPARALAEELVERGYRVAFAVDSRGRKYLDGLHNIDIHLISAGPSRPGLKGKILFALSLLQGYRQSRRLIGQLKPSVAVGFGGYPCAPPMFAAQHKGVPTILHEQNAILGLANILLAPFAKTIALSHASTKGLKPSWQKKAIVTGNPVRADIISVRDKPFPPIAGQLNILIFGGSLGAASFAQIIPYSMIMLASDLDVKLQITHQARDSDVDAVRKIYSDAGLDAEIKPFFDNIPARLENTHLLICRSGASTIAETTCAGRAAVYIPYPWHKDQQQLHNAQVVVAVGGGWVIEEKNLNAETLHQLLKGIVPAKLGEAAAFARSLGEPDAVLKLADQVIAGLKN